MSKQLENIKKKCSAFLSGMGSVMDMGADLPSEIKPSRFAGEILDFEAIRSDFEMTGIQIVQIVNREAGIRWTQTTQNGSVQMTIDNKKKDLIETYVKASCKWYNTADDIIGPVLAEYGMVEPNDGLQPELKKVK